MQKIYNEVNLDPGKTFILLLESKVMKDIRIYGLVRVLGIAADVIRESREASCDRKRCYEILTQKHRNYFCDTPDDEKTAIYKFDNYLFCWALKIWPRALDIIRERERCRR